MSATAGSGVQAAKAFVSPVTADAVKTAKEAMERLRMQVASVHPGGDPVGVRRELDAALGEWHDALCRSVIAAMNKCLQRRKDQACVVGGCASLFPEALKELEKAANAFKNAGVVAARKGTSRYSDGIQDVDADGGWTNFFQRASCAMPVLSTVQAAMGAECEGYVICSACGTALKADCKDRHVRKCEKLEAADRWSGGRFETMTAEWALQQAGKSSYPYLRLYSLESPLCYGVNAAMREVALSGKRKRYQPMKGFAYSLHRSLMSQPKYEGTVFRAVDFRVSESLYSVGAVVTMPHPTSASEQLDVVKDFLGQGGGGNGVQGTILVMRVRTGRSIAQFSRFPEDKEVLIAANTQFRVVGRPDFGVMHLLEMVLDTSLRNVVVVELQEIDFDHWGRLADIMTEVEKMRNVQLLDIIKTKIETGRRFAHHPVTREGAFVCYPPSTEMPVVDGKTLLEVAVEVEHNEQVVSLCCANLAPAAHADALNTALVSALQMNKGGSHDNTAAVLLSKGANVSRVPHALRTAGVALIACACKRAVLDKVMHTLGDTFWGVYKKEGPREGWTVLHAAAAINRADLLKDVLLSGGRAASTTYGRARNTTDAMGRSACSVAAACGSVDAVRILTAAKADVNLVDSNGTTPCYMAAKNGHANTVRLLITEGHADVNKATSDGETPCCIAARNGHTDVLSVLITEGHADVNIPMKNGATPCILAAMNGHTDVLRFLITEGQADLNKAASNGVTPCAIASQNGWTDALRILITEGHADVNKAANDGATPCALASQHGRTHTLRILITEGQADVNKAANSGATPCAIASQYGRTDALRILIREGHADVNKAANDGATPCAIASQHGRTDALRVLITEGQVDVNRESNSGATPCAVAAQNGRIDALRILISEGHADVNKASNDGATPCFMAAQNGHASALQVLITEGNADATRANNNSDTPLSAARQAGHIDATAILSAAMQ